MKKNNIKQCEMNKEENSNKIKSLSKLLLILVVLLFVDLKFFFSFLLTDLTQLLF